MGWFLKKCLVCAGMLLAMLALSARTAKADNYVYITSPAVDGIVDDGTPITGIYNIDNPAFAELWYVSWEIDDVPLHNLDGSDNSGAYTTINGPDFGVGRWSSYCPVRAPNSYNTWYFNPVRGDHLTLTVKMHVLIPTGGGNYTESVYSTTRTMYYRTVDRGR